LIEIESFCTFKNNCFKFVLYFLTFKTIYSMLKVSNYQSIVTKRTADKARLQTQIVATQTKSAAALQKAIAKLNILIVQCDADIVQAHAVIVSVNQTSVSTSAVASAAVASAPVASAVVTPVPTPKVPYGINPTTGTPFGTSAF
jgi:hypothetical protein